MKTIDHCFKSYFYNRRVEVLSDSIADLLPVKGRILDIGCGDGLISSKILGKKKSIEIEGADVLLRPVVNIPAIRADGGRLPYSDASFDAVMLVDVLHHSDDPVALLREAIRVSRNMILIKDHRLEGLLAGPILRYLDWIGNAPHGVSIPANYWTEKQWRNTLSCLNLQVSHWSNDIPLFPSWISWLFGRSLHFIAVLSKNPA